MTLQTDHRFVGMVSPMLAQFKRKTTRLYNFRCVFCGDSKKNIFKARGYLFELKGSLVYKCHNCATACSLYKLLEHLNPTLARAYMLETFGERGSREKNALIETIPNNDPDSAIAYPVAIDLGLPTISELSDEHRARQYLLDRKIPESRFDDLFYARNMKDLEALNPLYKDRLVADERIVIPFRDENYQIVGVTGRAMGHSSLRYCTIRIPGDKPLVYGLSLIDFTKHIWVVEGQFDSMNVENSVAPGGTDLARALAFLPEEQTTLVFDNQPRNKQIVKRVEYYCKQDRSLVIWPSTWAYKDINNAVVAGLTTDEVMEILKRNTYRGPALKLAIRDWKKC